jgi:MASE7
MGRQSLPLASDLTRFGSSALGTWRWLAAYAASPDPRIASCNAIALLVASNQPFYPLWVYFSVSRHIAPTLLTLLSTPFFLAVPAVSRRFPVMGRALLPLTGLANVVVSAKAFGAASGVAMFIIPCALIAVAFFRPSERVFAFALLALALATFLGIDSHSSAPIHVYSQTEYAAFFRLNALSASALVTLLGFILSGLVKD